MMQFKSKQLIEQVLKERNYTLTRLAREIELITGTKTSVQNISNKLNRDAVKLNDLEMWLNIMGYKLTAEGYDCTRIALEIYPYILPALTPEKLYKVLSLLQADTAPIRAKLNLRNRIVHSSGSDLDIEHIVDTFIHEAAELRNFEGYF